MTTHKTHHHHHHHHHGYGLGLFFSLSVLLLILNLVGSASGFGSMGPIAAAFGDSGFFCAIDASGKQGVICWGQNTTSSSQTQNQNPYEYLQIPPTTALAGGDGFLCGILTNSSHPYCWKWNSNGFSAGLVPPPFATTAYSHIAAGKSHVCAVRGSYYSANNSGSVDCWDIVGRKSDHSSGSKQSNLFSKPSSMVYNSNLNTLSFTNVISGDGFSCGGVSEGGLVCWGPNSTALGISGVSDNFVALASGLASVCGISQETRQVKCWGNSSSFLSIPVGTRFVSLAAGAQYYCGIREDDHGVECWGSFDSSSIPKGSGFFAIASARFVTCGIREVDLVLDCWFTNASLPHDYDPPLELCSPGLCTPTTCVIGEFTFNASILNEPDLATLCVRKELNICLPCALNCSQGSFPSSSCTGNADRVCTPCSLCQNSSCLDVCKLQSSSGEMKRKHGRQLQRLVLVLVSSVLGITLIVIAWCFLPDIIFRKDAEGKKQYASCIGKDDLQKDASIDASPPVPSALSLGIAQVFRLSELKDATNGFKEFNELGRGSYGFVYKAVLSDGRQVAVKRANAATIIRTNNRDFETELEILCNVRHSHIVNLLGYCTEMGEMLLVYEFMPHGTLHDHLHGGLSPLNWSLRLKIVMQAAKGLEYLHREVVPPIVHRDVKSSNILLDGELGARIADFGLLIIPNDKDIKGAMKEDVYNFGIVLLEILSGRRTYDGDSTPQSIVDWALPFLRNGKAAALIDRYVALPRNVEPLLRLADIAELAVKENPSDRPTMSDVAASLEQLVKDGLVL